MEGKTGEVKRMVGLDMHKAPIGKMRKCFLHSASGDAGNGKI